MAVDHSWRRKNILREISRVRYLPFGKLVNELIAMIADMGFDPFDGNMTEHTKMVKRMPAPLRNFICHFSLALRREQTCDS